MRQIVVQPEGALLGIPGVGDDQDLLELRSRAPESEVRLYRPQTRLRGVAGEAVRTPQRRPALPVPVYRVVHQPLERLDAEPEHLGCPTPFGDPVDLVGDDPER